MNLESENKNLLDELFEVIEASEFKAILVKSQFVFRDKYYKENKDGRHDLYVVCYESEHCFLGFFYELGGGLRVSLAPKAPRQSSWESMKWFLVDHLVSFLLKERIIRWRDRSSYSRKENIKRELNSITQRLEPVSDQVFHLFNDEKTIAQWKVEFEKYVKTDFERQYKLKQQDN